MSPTEYDPTSPGCPRAHAGRATAPSGGHPGACGPPERPLVRPPVEWARTQAGQKPPPKPPPPKPPPKPPSPPGPPPKPPEKSSPPPPSPKPPPKSPLPQ